MKKQGFLLIIVISLLSVCSFLAIYFYHAVKQNVMLTRHFRHHVISQLLLRSGHEFAASKALADITQKNPESHTTISVGPGTYRDGGDLVSYRFYDSNSRINVNDGIQAGYLELEGNYQANLLDPWEPGLVEGSDESISALLNLRLRYLLNAYGDVHRTIDHVYDNDANNVSDPDYYQPSSGFGGQVSSDKGTHKLYPLIFSTKPFTGTNSSPDARLGYSLDGQEDLTPASYNNGLGDLIIRRRPPGGYKQLSELEDLVNIWSSEQGIELSEDYLESQSFYELIKGDLTTTSYEDTQFFRLDEMIHTSAWNRYPNLSTIPGGALSTSKYHPISLGEYGHYGSIKNFPLWKNHSVPLINLRSASFFVRAALFYSLTNVLYTCESTATVPPYYTKNSQIPTNFGNDFFDQTTGKQSAIANPYIGQSYHVSYQHYENGNTQGAKTTKPFSMRDSLHLAKQMEIYESSQKKLLNFGDFYDFLIWHETNVDHYSEEQNQIIFYPPYEKARPLGIYPETLDGLDFNAGGSFKVSETPHSSYPNDPQIPDNSTFDQSYAAETLPHILSCIRRIPGYLGAPSALQSPYILLKPKQISVGESPPDHHTYLGSQEPFRKVEDFVWRFIHPKICFLSCGHYRIETESSLRGPEGEELASDSEETDTILFQTRYLRTQKDFLTFTDLPSSHSDIKIGPNHTTSIEEADPFIGCVGLKDFENDINLDPLTPQNAQIIMNFNASQGTGFSNSAGNPQPQDPLNDPWLDALEDHALLPVDDLEVESAKSLLNSQMEGSQAPFFINYDAAVTQDSTDLSCFNGALFLGTNRNIAYNNNDSSYGFNDSLYWRLDPWLDTSQGNGDPFGKNLSSGLISLWFRIPSNMSYTSSLMSQNPLLFQIPTKLETISRTLVSLNFWEIFSANPLDNPTFVRPVALTVGLKQTEKDGLVAFTRYDSGGPSYSSAGAAYPYIAPPKYSPSDPLSVPSPELTLPGDQFDYLGILCLMAPQPEENNYDSYRSGKYRSLERSVKLPNTKASRPGAWQRLMTGWNFRWSETTPLTPENQLWIRHLNAQNSELQFYEDYESDSSTYTSGSGIENPLDLKGTISHYPGGDSQEGGGIGFMLPFNPTMVLSLGESHALRLTNFNDQFFATPSPYTFLRGFFTPYWRFNSTIDNVRIKIGESTATNPPQLDPESNLYNNDQNIFRAMRYNVTRAGENWHPEMPAGHHQEPEWVIKPDLKGSKILSIGCRVYYPSDDSNNYPYIKLGSYLNDTESPFDVISEDEQDFIYTNTTFNAGSSFNIRLKYCAHQPNLNGTPSDIGPRLIYNGTDTFFTNLPWIKEVHYRYVP